MSEYRYYEFAAVDRPLSQKEMSELRELSSRAEITPRSLTNEYQWGAFRGDPRKLMEKYFDAFIYLANWGTRRLMFRLPKKLFNAKLAARYCDDERLSLREKGESVVLEIACSEEGGEWVETDNWMNALLPLREQLIAGDLRSLYLVWLRGAEIGEIEDDAIEPPLPPGLGKLSEPLRVLAEFIWLDQDLISAAAEGDSRPFAEAPSLANMAEWIDGAPANVKNDWLLRVASGDVLQVSRELQLRFREAQKAESKPPQESSRPPRTARQLLESRESIASARIAKEQKQEAQRKARREREQLAALEKRLVALAQREPAAWREVEKLIQAGGAQDYDKAVGLLQDLCALAERNGRIDGAHQRIGEFRKRYSGRTALIRRFNEGKLPTNRQIRQGRARN